MPDEVLGELPCDRALELGCGTGFFLLNLIQSGVARRGSVTDLSPGMVKVATRNGQSLGLDIDGRVADAEGIPYEDNTFDLVVGHAVLHHIPDVELSLREVVRVLKPGGRFVFAGEPTTVGNGYARALADLTWKTTIRVVKLPGLGSWRRPQAEIDENSRAAALEWVVDLHTFEPEDLEQMATNAGAAQVQTATVEFTAAMLGLADAHLRVDGAAGQAGLELGAVRLHRLEDAELDRRQRLAARGAERLVLQRHDHRGQAVLSSGSTGLQFSTDDVRYLSSDAGAAALGEVAEFALTDATRIADIASVRARFGDAPPSWWRRRCCADGPPKSWLAWARICGRGLAVHRRGAAAGHRGAGGRASGAAAGRPGRPRRDLLDRHRSWPRWAARRPERWAATSTRCGWRWHGTTWVPRADLCRADALHPVTRDAVVLVDPARRSAGRRRFDPSDYQPALDALLDSYRGRDLVVKCSPGIDFDELGRLGFDGEIEVTSDRGSVREACLWSAGLAEPGVRRRASMLDAGTGIAEITDAEPDDCPCGPPGRWIVDPDGAVVRAGLVRHYAARHGLWQLDPDIAYLSGDRLPPGVRGFEVLERLAFDERRLRQALSALDCGALEILVRGVDVDPDALRRRLRLRGSRPLSVVITRIGSGSASRATAFVCRPSR